MRLNIADNLFSLHLRLYMDNFRANHHPCHAHSHFQVDSCFFVCVDAMESYVH